LEFDMAKATFTNEQLCLAWRKQTKAEPQGTRRDVVRDLMGQMNMDPDDADDYRKVYNNVTQRVKQLASHKTTPINFPDLAVGKKGTRRTESQMANLQALLDGDDTTEETPTE
jgi:hypothetical protein